MRQEPGAGIGDHATNIAEAAYYLDTGRQMSSDAGELTRTQIKV